MVKLNKLQQVKLIIAASLTILFIILCFVFYTNIKNQTAFGWVNHSAEVIVKLEQIYSKVNDFESAFSRPSVYKENAFGEPYQQIGAELRQTTKELEKLVFDNLLQLKKAKVLTLLIDERLKALHYDLVDSRIDVDPANKLVMKNILSNIKEMKQIEEVLMRKRLAAATHTADSTTFAIIIALLISSIFILSASLILIREYKTKVKIEKKLLRSQLLLKEKVNKLDASNIELEQFAYIASHDLQEPLRKIITINNRITDKFSATIDSSLKDYLDRSIHAAERMRILIDDLLEFSRVTKGDIAFSPINLEDVFDIIKDGLEVQIEHKQASFIQHNSLPIILGDKIQLVRLFQNLISNAIKFTPPSRTPLIEISCKTVYEEDLEELPEFSIHKSYYKITIKDNGIGFKKEFQEKIFVIFQRLHGRSEYEGTGIGLSICKKIVENHHGFITTKSEEGIGSEFNIYLPITELI